MLQSAARKVLSIGRRELLAAAGQHWTSHSTCSFTRLLATSQRHLSMSAQHPPFINLEEVEQLAKSSLPKMAFDYFAAGAETEQAVGDNRSAFRQYRILPRILVDVSEVSTSCNMFGEPLCLPITQWRAVCCCSTHIDHCCAYRRACINLPVRTCHSLCCVSLVLGRSSWLNRVQHGNASHGGPHGNARPGTRCQGAGHSTRSSCCKHAHGAPLAKGKAVRLETRIGSCSAGWVCRLRITHSSGRHAT
jgi:hypothetical protein